MPKLPSGEHNVTVYAWDAAGNVGASETVTFTVAEPDIFPTVPVTAVFTASISALAAGFFLYHRKRPKRDKTNNRLKCSCPNFGTPSNPKSLNKELIIRAIYEEGRFK